MLLPVLHTIALTPRSGHKPVLFGSTMGYHVPLSNRSFPVPCAGYSCQVECRTANVLFDLASGYLAERKILLPGVTTLARLVGQVRDRAEQR